MRLNRNHGRLKEKDGEKSPPEESGLPTVWSKNWECKFGPPKGPTEKLQSL